MRHVQRRGCVQRARGVGRRPVHLFVHEQQPTVIRNVQATVISHNANPIRNIVGRQWKLFRTKELLDGLLGRGQDARPENIHFRGEFPNLLQRRVAVETRLMVEIGEKLAEPTHLLG